MLVLLNGLQAGNRSGTGVYTAELAYWLPQESDDAEIVTVWPRDVEHPRLGSLPHGAFHLREGRGPIRRVLYDQWGIKRDRKRLRADLVHYPASVGALCGAENMVVTVHDVSFLHNPGWFRSGRALYYRHGVARSVRLAKRVIAVSQATANDLVERLNVPSERVDVVPNGVGESFRPVGDAVRNEVCERYGLPEAFLLYVGTLEPRKNLARLIQAWSSVAGQCPHHLVLAGREGWGVGSIRRAAAGSPHAERIRFLGHVPVEDLPALYGAAAASLYPSLFEGFGLPVLEAMACGTPVLTSKVSSLPEVAGEAALSVDPTDVEAISEGILRLLTDQELRRSLKEKGTARAAEFSWRRTAQRTLESYRAALAP
jgi:glycosyltransferase involved in cell wall biosynthesis